VVVVVVVVVVVRKGNIWIQLEMPHMILEPDMMCQETTRPNSHYL
jgi:hypothetical protein